jgi:hypothetical protein
VPCHFGIPTFQKVISKCFHLNNCLQAFCDFFRRNEQK